MEDLQPLEPEPLPTPPRIAAIIVNYQSYTELRDCLASLEADLRTLEPRTLNLEPGTDARAYSLLVVDHESQSDAADGIERTFPAVRLLRVPANDGFAAGVNRGARDTDGTYLLLVNPDCVVEAGLCRTLAEWMEAHPDVGAAGPRIRNSDGSVQASARRFPDVTTVIAGRSSWLTRALPGNPLSRWNLPFDASAEDPSDIDWVSGACVMIRRAAFEAVGGMDEGFFLYWEDADFCRRLKQAGWRTVYFPGVTARHSGGRSSRHAADASLVAFHRSAFRLFWKHASAPAKLLAPLVYVILRLRLMMVRALVKKRSRGA